MTGKYTALLLIAFLPGNLGGSFGIFDYRSGGDEFPECQRDVDKLVSSAKDGALWALKIIDASTKLPSGILTGHVIDYGNYDECLDSPDDFRTQYCPATIFPQASSRGVTSNDSSILAPMGMRWGYCIPASCPAIFLENTLKEAFQDAKLNVTVFPWDCDSGQPKSLTASEIAGVAIWGVFIVLAIASTVYDVAVKLMGEEGNPWLRSFSMYTNGKNIMKMEVSSETMTPLHGIRFLSICWVVFGHRYFLTTIYSLLNLVDFAKEMEKITSQFYFQAVLAVDTFFLLSGLLNCYYLMKVLDQTKRFPFGMYYIHRYLRLTPALAAIVMMYATWYILIGDGPDWIRSITPWKDFCVKNWWPTLLYINNYYNPVEQCAGQSWYLAVDMQLYWLSPLIVVPMWKWPRFASLYLWLLLVVSTIIQFGIAFVRKFRMPFDFGFNLATYLTITKYMYVPTHTRATPYIIGIMLGKYLYNMRKNNTRLQLTRRLAASGWILSTVICLTVFFSQFQFSRPIQDHPYNRWESSIYIALHRIGWGISISWVILACLSERGGIVNSFLSWRGFVPLSRLTYCIFLVHIALQQYNLGTARTSNYFQHFNLVHRFFGDLCISVLAAFVLSLLFESPILVLEKLTMRKPRERNVKTEVNAGFKPDSSDANS